MTTVDTGMFSPLEGTEYCVFFQIFAVLGMLSAIWAVVVGVAMSGRVPQGAAGEWTLSIASMTVSALLGYVSSRLLYSMCTGVGHAADRHAAGGDKHTGGGGDESAGDGSGEAGKSRGTRESSMTVIDGMFGPLGREYCDYFYILMVLTVVVVVAVVLTGIYCVVAATGPARQRGARFASMLPTLLVLLVAYFQNRLLYSMCIR